MGVSTETSKQLDSRMKLMGLTVVFMVLNVLPPAESAPVPAILFLPAAPAAVALPAGTGALLTAKALLAGKVLAVKGAGGIATFATAAAVTAYQQLEQEQETLRN